MRENLNERERRRERELDLGMLFTKDGEGLI